MRRNRQLGIHLLAGSVLTLIWVFACPQFANSGQTQMQKQELSSDSTYVETDQYYELDMGRFAAGEIVIWSAVFGAYFLTKRYDD